jgi:phosphoribosylaminoimidazole-succinocarboxamide synthase
MLVKKARPLPVECIVRGYLSGSGWQEYQAAGTVCGIRLPAGLRESEKLPEPIFTPSTKADVGQHDENISFEKAAEILGHDAADKVQSASLTIYKECASYALTRGIIIADTKFEFGTDEKGVLTLIDEVLTPDSSRFWPADQYQPGANPPSFDKQYVRDYLESLGWNKKPPAPKLPPEVIARTAEKYREALTRLTGNETGARAAG